MDHNTPHDRLLICHQSQNQKINRIKELKNNMKRWYTPPSLCNHIIIKIKDYYKMEIHDSEFKQIPLVSDHNSRKLDELLTSQNSIGRNHFIWGRLSKLFKPLITKYYKTNRQGKKNKATTWMKNIIQGVWNIHLDDWSFFCRSIFDSGNGTIGDPSIKRVSYNLSLNIMMMPKKYIFLHRNIYGLSATYTSIKHLVLNHSDDGYQYLKE